MANIIERAAGVIAPYCRDISAAKSAARELYLNQMMDADPKRVCTEKELRELDPDTLLLTEINGHPAVYRPEMAIATGALQYTPLVILAPGSRFRAARNVLNHEYEQLPPTEADKPTEGTTEAADPALTNCHGVPLPGTTVETLTGDWVKHLPQGAVFKNDALDLIRWDGADFRGLLDGETEYNQDLTGLGPYLRGGNSAPSVVYADSGTAPEIGQSVRWLSATVTNQLPDGARFTDRDGDLLIWDGERWIDDEGHPISEILLRDYPPYTRCVPEIIADNN